MNNCNGNNNLASVVPHPFWSRYHTTTAPIDPKDGSIIVYKTFGKYPNNWTLTGSDNFAVGQRVVEPDPQFTNNILLGYQAGTYMIGTNLESSIKGSSNIMIGAYSGPIPAMNSAFGTGIGYKSGNNAGSLSLSLGTYAGTSMTNPGVVGGSNTIILNATNSELYTENSNCFIVKPIRENVDAPGSLKNLVYNDITGEVMYE